MAALGKIRSKGALLIAIIALGLFAFIAEEMVRSCETTKNNQRQQVGEVLGEKINFQDFQKLVDEYTDVIKMQQGAENLNEDQLNQVKDMVWNSYVQTKMIEKEANALGLTVTDAELQNILKQGTSPLLMQTPFINQQTGRFDVNQLQKFLAEYKTQQSANPQLAQQYQRLYKYWSFIEKTLRQQTLAQKYQALLASCFLSNPIEAKASFKEENEEAQIQLAALPYSSIEDSKVTVEKSDLKAKYNELKPRFEQFVESRDIKYIDIVVEASATDKAAIQKDFEGYRNSMLTATDPAEVVRKSASLVSYLGLPVTKAAFPSDIATRLDSMSVGQTTAVFNSAQDNTLNIIKLVAKTQMPDSIQYRQIQVAGETPEASKATADSIYNALMAGADFEALAKKYNQTGDKAWATTAQYQSAPSIDNDSKNFINTLNSLSVNETKVVNFTQGSVVLQVVDRKAMVDKYLAAVVKKTIDFSKDTYSAAYNKFSTFVSANDTEEKILKNATKSGYTVREANDITTAQHNLAGIHSTREAMKWLFEAKEKEVSPMYECGDNNHLLVAVLDKIHTKGYRGLDDTQVMDMVKAEVIKDKKAEMLMAKVKGVKSVNEAKAKGANVTTINQTTFASPVFVAATGSSEAALSGAIAATAKGKFCKTPVKGNAGVYLFSVTAKTMRPGKLDVKSQESKLSQKAMQMASGYMNELYANAKVVDNRYLFF